MAVYYMFKYVLYIVCLAVFSPGYGIYTVNIKCVYYESLTHTHNSSGNHTAYMCIYDIIQIQWAKTERHLKQRGMNK